VKIIPILANALDKVVVENVIKSFSINTIYHAAAYKHVPIVEQNTVSGIRNNVWGTFTCAEAAMKFEVENFVLISTDKAVRPTNVMGTSKRLAELVLQALAEKDSKTNFSMVRFGNVLGSSGSVVPLFKKQIAAGDPVTITHPDITRYFMTIPEAAQLVIQAGAMGQGGEVYVLDMGKPVKINDLAQKMIHLSGLTVKSETNPDGDIEITYTGLRPGEKLYEELLIGENVEGTEHQRIMKAKEISLSWDDLQTLLAKLKAAMDAGRLVSDEIVLAMIKERLAQPDAKNGFILDGFPRNIPQAEALDIMLDKVNQPLQSALLIDVDFDSLIQRLTGRRTCESCGQMYNIYTSPSKLDDQCDKCGGNLHHRTDDNEETIGNRLRVYEAQTAPLIGYYKAQNRLRTIEGIGDISDIFSAVCKVTKELPDRVEFTLPIIEDLTTGTPVAAKPAVIKRKIKAPAPMAEKAAATKITPKKKATGKKKAMVKKIAVKKPATKKAPAKKAVKKEVVTKKATTKKKAITKAKTTAKKKVTAKKKDVTQKKTIKKATAKKAPAKKSAVKKKIVAAKKKAIKKVASKKKTAVKKKVATKKKAAVKKPSTKKTAAAKKKGAKRR